MKPVRRRPPTTTLSDCQPGQRFRLAGLKEVTGTLIRLSAGAALVRYDAVTMTLAGEPTKLAPITCTISRNTEVDAL